MSMNVYFLRQSDTMTCKKNQVANASEDNTSTHHANIETPTGARATSQALCGTVDKITLNISKITDEKLGPISELVMKQ